MLSLIAAELVVAKDPAGESAEHRELDELNALLPQTRVCLGGVVVAAVERDD